VEFPIRCRRFDSYINLENKKQSGSVWQRVTLQVEITANGTLYDKEDAGSIPALTTNKVKPGEVVKVGLKQNYA
jgi:hypothetical protein